MNYESRRMKSIKHRSQSMPTINPIILPQPIHKIRKLRHERQDSLGMKNQHLPVISLLHINSKEEDDLSNKIKVLAGRSVKKLQEKYETIDRWKQKYIPEGHKQPKFKPNFNEVFPPVQEKQDSEEPISPKADSTPSNTSQKLFPIISKQPLNPEIPDQREQSRKLQAELMARLQRNKRYYEIKNEHHKDINYFQHSNSISIDKRRQIDLQKMLSGAKKNKLLSIFHKNFSSKDHYPEMELVKEQLKKRSDENQNFFEEKSLLSKQKKKKSISIHEFKQSLLQQAVEETPQGWDIPNELPSPQNDQSIED